MDTFLSALRLALERGWALGLLLIVFFGLVIAARRHDVPLPETLTEWSTGGVLFGLAVIIVSLISAVGRGVGRVGQHGLSLVAKRQRAKREERDALANISTLSVDEIKVLMHILERNPVRLEVHPMSYPERLLEKRLLVPVQFGAGGSLICELHPALKKLRKSLLEELTKALRAESERR